MCLCMPCQIKACCFHGILSTGTLDYTCVCVPCVKAATLFLRENGEGEEEVE